MQQQTQTCGVRACGEGLSTEDRGGCMWWLVGHESKSPESTRHEYTTWVGDSMQSVLQYSNMRSLRPFSACVGQEYVYLRRWWHGAAGL